jgi:hypothetical protein
VWHTAGVRKIVRAWTLVPAVLLLCLLAVGAAYWLRSRALSPEALLRRLPQRDALIVYIDFDALRRAGVLKLLDGSKTGLDADYRGFIDKTGFDYTRDLDVALAAFAPDGKFLALRGRFDWTRLNSYVAAQQGRCSNGFCRMVGSAPERQISFFPIRENLMALAVSRDDSAALRLNAEAPVTDAPAPNAPLWLSIPASLLKSSDELPTGTRMFARVLSRAESVALSFSPEDNRLAARLLVRCTTDGDAAEIANQLNRTTSLLRDLIARDHQSPNPGDLSGVLSSGAFRSEAKTVHGYWPIERAFLENTLGAK